MTYFDRDLNPVTGSKWAELLRVGGYDLVRHTNLAADVSVRTVWVGCLAAGERGRRLFLTECKPAREGVPDRWAGCESEALLHHAAAVEQLKVLAEV